MTTFNGTAAGENIRSVGVVDAQSGSAGNAAVSGTVAGGTLANLQDAIADTINGGGGDDQILAGSQGDLVNGDAGDDNIGGMAGNDTLNGGTGFDELRYDRETGGSGAIINLVTGFATDTFGNTDTISNFEAVRGSSLGDSITGGAVANGTRTFGLLDGQENYRGLAGNDTINGGGGYDEVRYDHDWANGGTAGVTVNLTTGSATDGFGATDTLTSIEGVRGSRLADTLIGNSQDNTFVGFAGADSFSGGDGFDNVRYDLDASNNATLVIGGSILGTARVVVNLDTVSHTSGAVTRAANTATDGYGAVDTFTITNGITTIDTVRGTNNATGDIFWGRASVEHGDNFIGLAGADTIDGGIGYDGARYDLDADWNGTAWTGGTGAITVNLDTITHGTQAAGTATDGFGSVDTLISIEDARGSYLADRFWGNASNNAFRGFAGNDTIDGGAGDDTVSYDFDMFREGLTGTLGTAGVNVNLVTGFAVDGFGNTDTLISIENARGTIQADTFTGNDSDNTFNGLAGNDTLTGNGGSDEARYDQDEYAGGANAVTVNFATGFATDGFGNTDTLSGIEGARGTRFNDSFIGSGADEFFRGLKGNDTLNGGDGNDLASYINDQFAKAESETLVAVNVNLGTGFATDSWGNTDTLVSIENAAGGMLGDTFTGNGVDNLFRGYGGNDSINGAGGSDTVDYSRDRLTGDSRFLVGSGAVTVNLTTGFATDGFGDTDSLGNIENAIGTDGNDDFTDLAGVANTFTGGLGNDVYRISDASDVVVEAAGGDTGDRVQTTLATYTLAANVEQLYASGAGARVFIGNASDNIIQTGIVGSGVNADVIDGGSGADQMQGGDGNDTYFVDNAGDTVIGEGSNVNGGYDVVIATVNHTLAANVEQLVVQGGATSGTGNNSANYLYGGNSGLSLTLSGMDGDDVIYAGLAGGNTLLGGAGVDTLLIYGGNNTANGGTGSDIYYTYTATDVLSEAGGDGIDTVYATYSITVGEGFEQVLISGAATSITSTSATDNNIFYGNSAAGAVTLNGGGGADVLFGGSFADALNGGAGVDLMFGNGGADVLAGGNDTDVYYLTSGTETIVETLSGGFDTAYSNAAGTTTLASNVEQLILYGAATGGTGNADANYLYGHIASGAVTLDGAGGADYLLDNAASGDILIGGTGNDLLDLRTGGNDFIRYAAAGTNADTVLGFDADAAGGQDLINVSGRGFSAASIGGAITIAASGADTLVTIGTDTIRLVGVASANVTATDFVF